jgi:hypothetical protein
MASAKKKVNKEEDNEPLQVATTRNPSGPLPSRAWPSFACPPVDSACVDWAKAVRGRGH